MLETSIDLPPTQVSDAVEVSVALETARALWAKGQVLEAVRWIQRAAENAESAGNDLRAVSLARAAADLRAEISTDGEAAAPRTDAAALAPYDDCTESTIVDSPASSLARVAAQHNVQIAELQPLSAPVPPSSSAAPTPPAPLVKSAPLQHQALRVCVLAGGAESPERTVRVLREGDAVPSGAVPALLVLLDPNAKLGWG